MQPLCACDCWFVHMLVTVKHQARLSLAKLCSVIWLFSLLLCCRRGVAYKASILAYKVSGSCTGHGSVSTNATLSAIRQAADAEADVLNISYGDFRSGGYTDKRYAAALGAAMDKGALVAIASGNDGVYGALLNAGWVYTQIHIIVCVAFACHSLTRCSTIDTVCTLVLPARTETMHWLPTNGAACSVCPACLQAPGSLREAWQHPGCSQQQRWTLAST